MKTRHCHLDTGHGRYTGKREQAYTMTTHPPILYTYMVEATGLVGRTGSCKWYRELDVLEVTKIGHRVLV